jgi:hypothetical protein
MTPAQTLTLIAEEIEAGAEALFSEVKADLSWRAIAEAHKDMWRQRAAAVLVAAGAVRKAAVPVVTDAMVNRAAWVLFESGIGISPLVLGMALTAALTEPTP